MPHDINGQRLRVGDRVNVLCEITQLDQGDEFCNATVKTVRPCYPGTHTTVIALNTKQLAATSCRLGDSNAIPV